MVKRMCSHPVPRLWISPPRISSAWCFLPEVIHALTNMNTHAFPPLHEWQRMEHILLHLVFPSPCPLAVPMELHSYPVCSVDQSGSLWPFVLYQAPLSMEFFRQEYWRGLSFPSPGDLLDWGINPSLLHFRQVLYSLSHQGSQTSNQECGLPSQIQYQNTEMKKVVWSKR